MITDNQALRMGGREWAILLVLSVVWGASYFFFKILVRELPPFTIVLGRVAIASSVLWLVLLARSEQLPRDPAFWADVLVMSLLANVLPFTLIVYGETRISSGLAAVLNATTPIIAVVIAHFATRDERLTTLKLAGVVAGFAGVAVLVGPGVLASGGDRFGTAACLAGAVIYAFAGLYGRRFKGRQPLQVATAQLTLSVPILVPFALIVDRPWLLAAPHAGTWLALIGLATFSTAFAYVLYFHLLAVAGATNTLLVTFLLPINTLILGALFLGEALTANALGGMALIGIGLAAIDGRLFTRRRYFAARNTHRPR